MKIGLSTFPSLIGSIKRHSQRPTHCMDKPVSIPYRKYKKGATIGDTSEGNEGFHPL